MGSESTGIKTSPIKGTGEKATGRPTGPDFTPGRIAVGLNHVCAIGRDDLAACWGNSMWERFGPKPSPPMRPIKSIAVSGDLHCALELNGRVVCWGERIEKVWDVRPPRGAFKRMSVSPRLACAIDEKGTATFWGARESGFSSKIIGNNYGQDFKALTFADIACGRYAVCGTTGTGKLKCWGDGAHLAKPFIARDSTKLQSFRMNANEGNGGFACALEAGGSLICEGQSDRGRKAVPWNTSFVSAAPSDNWVCGLTTEGEARCWGDRHTSTQPPDGTFTDLGVGRNFACGVRQTCSVTCWGPGAKEVNKQTPPQFREQR